MPHTPGAERHLINPEHSRCLETWDMITLWGLAFVAIVTPVQVSMIEPKFDWMLGPFQHCAISVERAVGRQGIGPFDSRSLCSCSCCVLRPSARPHVTSQAY